MANGQILVSGPEQTDFVAIANTKSGQKSLWGNPGEWNDPLDAPVFTAINKTHDAVSEAFDLVGKVVDDPTRTDVQKHAFGRDVYNRVSAVSEASRFAIDTHANNLQRQALDLTNDYFRLDPNHTSRQEATRDFIAKTAMTEGGLAKVRQLARTNAEVGAVILNNHDFLLGMSEELRQSMVDDAIEAHLPKVSEIIEKSMKLKKLAAGYAQHGKSLKSSLFNGSMADRASLRVQLP